MNKTNIVIEDAIYNNPQLLLALDNAEEIGLLFLPYSVGIELECFKKPNYDLAAFKAIPNIIDVNVDDNEQRYRIPNGINGLICLYEITLALHEFSELNEGSGSHFHTNFTDHPELINYEYLNTHKDWILKELDIWEYKGTYNQRNVLINSRCWVRFNNYSPLKTTMEVRIGSMSFDYSYLSKKIIHCNDIARRIKQNHKTESAIIKLKNILEKNKSSVTSSESKSEYEINKIISNRVVKYTY